MPLAYELVRLLHITGGTIALLLVPIPLLTQKGSRLHRRAGTLFVLAMLLSSLGGLAIALSWLVDPLRFRPLGSDASATATRASGLFLGTLALITLGGIQQLLRAPARKRARTPAPSLADRALPIATVVAGLLTAATGLVRLHGLLIAFGALAIAAGLSDLRFATRPLPTKMAWWYQHMRGAMVTVIAALTAFLVFGGRRWLAELVPAELRWMFWILPALVIVPATQAWIARFQRRFGEKRA